VDLVTVDRIGVSIYHDALRVVVVRGSAIIWRGEAAVRDPEALAGELAALIATAPRSKWQNREAVGAIGPRAAQLKRVAGMPASAGDRALSDAVRLNAARFFLRNGAPLVTSDVSRRNGEFWCAALHAPVVAALAEACRIRGVRFRGCVPSAAALGAGLTDGRVVWSDGDAVEEVILDLGECAGVRRMHSGERVVTGVRPPLAALGPDGARFADAYGAAIAGARSPLLVDPAAAPRAMRRRMFIRVALGICILTASAGVVAGPGIRGTLRERSAIARLKELSARSAAPLAAMRDLSSGTQVVRRVDAFASSRRSMVVLLGSLSQQLPDSTAIVSLHVDSIGGTLVALAPVGTTVLPGIAGASGIASAEITGAVTRETVAGAVLQRLVTAFHFSRPSRARPVPPSRAVR
jgi:hypothetical protein